MSRYISVLSREKPLRPTDTITRFGVNYHPIEPIYMSKCPHSDGWHYYATHEAEEECPPTPRTDIR